MKKSYFFYVWMCCFLSITAMDAEKIIVSTLSPIVKFYNKVSKKKETKNLIPITWSTKVKERLKKLNTKRRAYCKENIFVFCCLKLNMDFLQEHEKNFKRICDKSAVKALSQLEIIEADILAQDLYKGIKEMKEQLREYKPALLSNAFSVQRVVQHLNMITQKLKYIKDSVDATYEIWQERREQMPVGNDDIIFVDSASDEWSEDEFGGL